MSIKRKTINIKKVKLIRPKYEVPLPHKISSFFTEPVRVDVGEIKVTKKRKNIPTQKIKKAKQPKQIHKGPLVLSTKALNKLKPKEKQKKKRKKKKVAKISAFDNAFPSAPVQDTLTFSDDIVEWAPVRDSLVKQFDEAIHGIIGGYGGNVKRPAKVGADYAIEEFMRIPGIENDDVLADFLIQHPVHELFDYDMLYSAGIYFLSNGRKNTTFQVDKGIEEYSNMISGVLLAEMADGDFTEEEY